MSPAAASALAEAVQRNCHIADARHATELPLCIYLLQMREFYRWEQALPLGAALRHGDVGDWLDRRESLWAGLAGEGYGALPLDGEALDPFDTAAANQRLLPLGLVYGAGQLASGRPVFVLAELHQADEHDGLQRLVAGRELARGLAAPPGALCGDTVLLRRDALRRWLWEQHEAWGLRRGGGGAFGEALAACGAPAGDPGQAIDRLAEQQLETLWLHELGEHRAGALLGPGWAALRAASGHDRRIEPRLRALRDHLADCLVTLPGLLARGAPGPIHFWFANLEGVRLEMFPAAAAAYAAWRAGDGGSAIEALADAGSRHWLALGERAIALHKQWGSECGEPLVGLLSEPASRC